MKKINLDLKTDLNEAELNERGQTMSTAMLRYDEVEDQKKAATKELTEEMKGLRGQMRMLSKIIREKSEMRSVECLVRFHNPEVGIKRIIRSDTGEIVRDEPMDASERQNNLFDDINELNRLYGKPSSDTPEESASA